MLSSLIDVAVSNCCCCFSICVFNLLLPLLLLRLLILFLLFASLLFFFFACVKQMVETLGEVIDKTNTSNFGDLSPTNILLHLVTSQTLVDWVGIFGFIGLLATTLGEWKISRNTLHILRGSLLIATILLTLRLPHVILRKALDSAIARIEGVEELAREEFSQLRQSNATKLDRLHSQNAAIIAARDGNT